MTQAIPCDGASSHTISRDPEIARAATAILHCTAVDGLIALVTFVLAGAILREASWPLSRSVPGTPISVMFAVPFTVFSEWRNVYEIGSWVYLPDMPLVFGIGLTPLLQWVVNPPAATFLPRAMHSSRTRITP